MCTAHLHPDLAAASSSASKPENLPATSLCPCGAALDTTRGRNMCPLKKRAFYLGSLQPNLKQIKPNTPL